MFEIIQTDNGLTIIYKLLINVADQKLYTTVEEYWVLIFFKQLCLRR